MREASVAIGLLAGLISFAESRGAQFEALCAEAGVKPKSLDHPDRRVPLTAYMDTIRLAKAQTRRPAFALEFGESVGMSELSIVGLLMEASETIGDAYIQMQRYGRLAIEMDQISNGPRLTMVREQDKLFIVDRQRLSDEYPELTEGAFAWLVCGPRRYMDRSPVKSVSVTWEKPDYWDAYERVFQCPVHFKARWNALEMHPDSLRWPVRQNPKYVFGMLTERAESLVAELTATETTTGRLRNALAATLHEGQLTAERAAKQMGLSRQTLFRRLKSEGTTYSEVFDALRRELAQEYLFGAKATIHEVAFLVGYSDAASFTRAFKRWTGFTPGEFREVRRERKPGHAPSEDEPSIPGE